MSALQGRGARKYPRLVRGDEQVGAGGAPRAYLYLDVDGVLCPYVAPDETPTSWSDLGEGFVGRRIAVHSPSMLAALGRLGLEIVWCTTWGGQAEHAFGPALRGCLQRTLDLAATPLAPGGVKGAAVFTDLRFAPAPFVWVDDDAITVEAVERLETLELPMLLIEPDRTVGLEPGHVEQIEAFMRAQGLSG